MCYFVFVGVREREHAPFVNRMTALGYQATSTGNASVRAAFPEGDIVSVVVHKGCSCDLYAARNVAFDEDAQRAKYKKKNWSASKIERAILGKRPRERASFAAFRDAFAATVREAGGARILALSFSGSIDTEEFEVPKSVSMTLGAYLKAEGTYREAVLHDVRTG